jgi:hypothetical protein
VASFDIASVVHGRRSVVPVTAPAVGLPSLKIGDEVVVLGHIRRRFFRTSGRTQGITELVAEHVVVGARPAKVDKLLAALTSRIRETRSTVLPKGA